MGYGSPLEIENISPAVAPLPPAPKQTTPKNENKAIPMNQLSAEATQDRIVIAIPFRRDLDPDQPISGHPVPLQRGWKSRDVHRLGVEEALRLAQRGP